jgi:hypothetical protein
MQVGDALGNPLDEGFEAGRLRAAEAGIEISDVDAASAADLLRDVLGLEAESLRPKFVLLFSEQFGIASVARHHYENEPISFAEARTYLELTKTFFNGFTRP